MSKLSSAGATGADTETCVGSPEGSSSNVGGWGPRGGSAMVDALKKLIRAREGPAVPRCSAIATSERPRLYHHEPATRDDSACPSSWHGPPRDTRVAALLRLQSRSAIVDLNCLAPPSPRCRRHHAGELPMLASRSESAGGPPSSSGSHPTRAAITLLVVAGLSLLFRTTAGPGAAQNPQPDAPSEYGAVVRPLVQKYCMGCHSTKLKKGGLDLERVASPAGPHKDLKVWQQVVEMLDAGDMPPKAKPQPAAEERKALIAWVRGFLDAEARARAGDPGHVPLRRLSNAEYDYTIRDLTGVDLRPTREFPADGAAGEGFTNAAEALSEISPALFAKYLNAAKDVSEHAMLLPDGFRFSPTRTRRDWTDKTLARIRQFYAVYTVDGRIPLQTYFTATVRHRAALAAGDMTLKDVAAKEKLNARYLGVLWQTLTAKASSYPVSSIRARWRQASEKEVPALVAEIAAWQAVLWKFVPVGSYRYGNTVRQLANDPAPAGTQELRVALKPSGGQSKAPPTQEARWDGKSAVATSLTSASYKQLLQGYADFRRCFPQFICFPRILPDDEVVCLKMYHREDEPLARLFLDADQKRHLDQLWDEHRFISQQPIAENNYLPQFIGFVTQDQPKELIAYFEGQREPFRKRAEEFAKEVEAAVPKQLDALLDFAARAYRRPLQEQEKRELLGLYRTLRGKGLAHEEAFRGVLARVLVSPAFLFRVEQAPPGKAPGPVNDWELATRLSYFLWSSIPDDELRRVAAAGQLRDPNIVAAQARRMLKDDRARALAIEFGTQWIHVRGFDELKEKNEKLFPTFDATLRQAIYEESILFFQDLFQGDRPVTQILDADYTFLNETLAKHYGIPGVTGPQWRRVEGVRKYGRGGVLGLASVQARQSGASRTSPVLRGNWVVETLLGEKLPRPPANVPRLPEEETDGLTMRQQVEKHTRVAACAVCHQRIDPFGFALEKYDPIGRRREKELGGAGDRFADQAEGRHRVRRHRWAADVPADEEEGRDRPTVLPAAARVRPGAGGHPFDELLIDEMVAELNRNDGRVSAAVLAIVRSPQFRMIRGSALASDE